MTSFARRLTQVFADRGHLCVGIDPHAYLLAEWGLADDARSLREFGLRVVDAAAVRVGIIKPQVAFFERHGSAGYAALEAVFSAARDAGLLVIADAKRGDVGSTVEAYGQAWLTPGAPLEADAMTVSAFQGVGSLSAPIELARREGKGIFVLAATSNPESSRVQSAITTTVDNTQGDTVSSAILRDIRAINRLEGPGLGSVGAVIGATVDFTEFGFDDAALAMMPILAPGLGHQGARFDQLAAIYGTATENVVVSASRTILAAGPSGLVHAIETQAREVAQALASAVTV